MLLNVPILNCFRYLYSHLLSKFIFNESIYLREVENTEIIFKYSDLLDISCCEVISKVENTDTIHLVVSE